MSNPLIISIQFKSVKLLLQVFKQKIVLY